MRRNPDPSAAAEAIRHACIETALAGYEDARVSGLCADGAWEAAISAMRRLDLGTTTGDGDDHAGPHVSGASASAPRSPGDVGSLRALTAALAGLFATAGPPGAGSAAAVTGALAGALVEWAADSVARRERTAEGSVARVIARRARAARTALATAGERDARAVEALMAPVPSGVSVDAARDAHASLLKIATQSARVAGLALELLPHVRGTLRSDVEAALRLSVGAAHCALDLSGGEPPAGTEAEWARAAKRSAWQTRLLLQRATGRLDRERS